MKTVASSAKIAAMTEVIEIGDEAEIVTVTADEIATEIVAVIVIAKSFSPKMMSCYLSVAS